MGPAGISIRRAVDKTDYESFARLAQQFSAWLGEDLCFQNFQQELEGLPGCYAEPLGAILLASAVIDGEQRDVGCVAIRPLSAESAAAAEAGSPQAPAAPSAAAAGHMQPQPQPPQHQQQPAKQGTACEVKRLWVEPSLQKGGVGRALVLHALEAARAAGHRLALLDTLERLSAANRLYASLGFSRCAPYYNNPLDAVVYWKLRL